MTRRPTAAEATPSGWMPGVFRELRHWVAPDARSMTHEFGVTFYAACHSPCLHIPEASRIWLSWPTCVDCLLANADPHRSLQWWGIGVLQREVAHMVDSGPLERPGGLALCGTWLIAAVTDPRNTAGTRPCSACVERLAVPALDE